MARRRFPRLRVLAGLFVSVLMVGAACVALVSAQPTNDPDQRPTTNDDDQRPTTNDAARFAKPAPAGSR